MPDGLIVAAQSLQDETKIQQDMLQSNSRINRIMPVLGFGTWELTGPACISGVENAIQIGYRHIDTAQIYGNEKEVGEGIKKAGVGRSELFITTKIARNNLQPTNIIHSTMDSLRKLDLDYIDMLLIHWPLPQMDLKACLESMQILQEKNLVRHIGVSNFSPELFMEAIEKGQVLNNQVKFSPYQQQMKNLELAKAYNKIITAYSPLAKGEISKDETLGEIGKNHDKSAAQVALRWLIQLGHVSVIPKAADEKHRLENFEIFDFELKDKEMKVIRELNKSKIKI
jgi:diketogulonate reductase-like aldo/keto reductase